MHNVIATCSNTTSGGANINTYCFCSQWYFVDNYAKAYAPFFHHILDKRHWKPYNGPLILPLEYKRSAGRPSSVRIRGTMDESREGYRHNRCSNCKQLGHNKTRCQNPPVNTFSSGYVELKVCFIKPCNECLIFSPIVANNCICAGKEPMEPGPITTDVLRLQHEHRSSIIDASRVTHYLF